MLTKNRIIIFAQNCLKRIMSQILEFLNVTKESTEEDCHMPIESYQYLIILLRVNQTAKHQEIKYRGVNCRGLNCRGLNCQGLNCQGLNCRGSIVAHPLQQPTNVPFRWRWRCVGFIFGCFSLLNHGVRSILHSFDRKILLWITTETTRFQLRVKSKCLSYRNRSYIIDNLIVFGIIYYIILFQCKIPSLARVFCIYNIFMFMVLYIVNDCRV